jgi:hypothetical protein
MRVTPVYRALSRVVHPDTATGDTRLQQELNDAYGDLGEAARMTTLTPDFADLLASGECTPRCLRARTPADFCGCHCGGRRPALDSGRRHGGLPTQARRLVNGTKDRK